jgi:hypothetical protein
VAIRQIIDAVDCWGSRLEGLLEVKGIQYRLKHHVS